jgi:hypothetical protein
VLIHIQKKTPHYRKLHCTARKMSRILPGPDGLLGTQIRNSKKKFSVALQYIASKPYDNGYGFRTEVARTEMVQQVLCGLLGGMLVDLPYKRHKDLGNTQNGCFSLQHSACTRSGTTAAAATPSFPSLLVVRYSVLLRLVLHQ